MQGKKSYYNGKTAAVTGAASGIGLALCELLLEYGADKVTLADFNQENLERETARLAATYPHKVQGILCNVTDREQVLGMVRQAAEFGGDRLDILINCAGAAFAGKFLFEPDGIDPNQNFLNKVLREEDWEKGFALNFNGSIYGCEAVVPLMIAQGGGQIVNIASGIAFSPMAYQSLYASSKAALVAYSYAIRNELHSYGVKVNAATPGTTATAIFTSAGQEAPPEAQSPRASAETILGGAAENRRLILGDESDEDGSKTCFLPDDFGKVLDEIYHDFARQRRSGNLSFVAKAPKAEASQLLTEALAISQLPTERIAESIQLIEKYATLRNSLQLKPAYYADKTAVVTGGASGIGFALCKKMLECGAKKVVLADFNQANLEKKEAELNTAFPEKVKGIFCNVADKASIKEMIASAVAWFDGSFDILINCAGIGQGGLSFPVPDLTSLMEQSGMLLETRQTWEQVYSVNLFGVLHGCRAVLPIMLEQGSGQIVNIISGTAMTPMPYQAIYSSAKAALNLATLTLRYEFADYGIKINSATPGTTATAIFEGTEIPKEAQAPETSAVRILTGAERNDRLIPGDDHDLKGLFSAHNPAAAEMLDKLMNEIAQARRGGSTTYGN